MHASPSPPYIFHHNAQNTHSEHTLRMKELLKYIPQLPHGYIKIELNSFYLQVPKHSQDAIFYKAH